MLSELHEYELTILEKHLDTFGHVNNATYLELYEEARWDLISNRNFGLRDIQKAKIGPVILRIDIAYKAELRNREKIKIVTQTKEYKNKLVMVLEQKMVKEDGTVASSAMLEIGLFDLKERRLIVPTVEWLKAIGVSEQPPQ
ncbi:acyl-CoA thioesterase [Halobacteriovorax sp. GB3]|uniref:acyl-CoA thioesterase n=1 Tax=Halobacteriovorax sp. GB3 TaxID=2719615 RepID=UPI002360A335|nr:acyl-CoA thioesterase [Halobacteriovorax sp. GB3]MDD0852374.1 acyl-CoA thioesterase [Halobacteriovorax sp. GB3]